MQQIDVSDIPDVLRDFRCVETQYEIPELGDDKFKNALLKLANASINIENHVYPEISNPKF